MAYTCTIRPIPFILLCGHKLVAMNFTELIGDIQRSIDELQEKLNELRMCDRTPDLRNLDMLLSRKEAAAFIGKSVRQLDRLCEKNVIRRVEEDGVIRIRKSELIRYQGIDIDCRMERLGQI